MPRRGRLPTRVSSFLEMGCYRSRRYHYRIGGTGARSMVTLTREMMRKGYHFGWATLYIGGGQGMAMMVERK